MPTTQSRRRKLWVIPMEDNAIARAILATHTTRKASQIAMNERIKGSSKKRVSGHHEVIIPMGTRPDWQTRITQALDETVQNRVREGTALEKPRIRTNCVIAVISTHPARDPEWHFID